MLRLDALRRLTSLRLDALGRMASLRAWPWGKRPTWRTLAVLGGGAAALAGIVTAAWLWFAAEQRRGLAAFAQAMVAVPLVEGPGVKPEDRAQAIRGLEDALGQRPSGAVAAQVTYELGNLKYAITNYDAARTAYDLAARGTSPTLRRLAQANLGYIWEAQKDYAKAIEAFEKALTSLKADDFLHDDLAMDLGRVQERAGRKDAAIATYRRVATNAKGPRSDEARVRLASLGVQL